MHRFRAQLERDVRRLPCPPVEGISIVQVSTGRVWNLRLDGNPFCGDANDPSENEFNDLRLFVRGLGVNNVERFEITIYDHEVLWLRLHQQVSTDVDMFSFALLLLFLFDIFSIQLSHTCQVSKFAP